MADDAVDKAKDAADRFRHAGAPDAERDAEEAPQSGGQPPDFEDDPARNPPPELDRLRGG